MKDVFPLLLAVAPLSMVLGAKAAETGLSFIEVALMTAMYFAGGSEFTPAHWATASGREHHFAHAPESNH
ncbi:MAG: AzlC family ABC transporter permease [Comamonas sp.]